MQLPIGLAFLIVLLFLAAITAASEIAIIASSRIKLRRLAASGSKAAKIILRILDIPERFFSTILVANDIVDALIAVLITAMIAGYLGVENKFGIFLATLIAAFLIIISEVSAKTFAANYAEKLALALAIPMRGLIILFSPVVRVLEVIIRFIVEVMGGKAKGKTSLMTEEEIRALIKIGEEEGVLHKEKYKMLSKVFEFSDTLVKKVMTPKKDMVSIDVNAPLEDIVNKVLESGYSRVPVYRNDPDNIIGVINMKDLLSLSTNKDLLVLQDIIYLPTVVSSSKKVTELLKEFQKGHTHLAIVADEKGHPEGLVTLEDLLEEIVGEIEDEYDVRATYYREPHE